MPLLGVQPVGAGDDSGISLALFTASSVFPTQTRRYAVDIEYGSPGTSVSCASACC
jgi:hypothetical protein